MLLVTNYVTASIHRTAELMRGCITAGLRLECAEEPLEALCLLRFVTQTHQPHSTDRSEESECQLLLCSDRVRFVTEMVTLY